MNVPLPPPSSPSSGIAPPAWQASALNPGPAPRSSSRGKIVVAIVVVAVIVAVIVVLVTRGGDSKGAIDASAAHDGLQAIYDDVAFGAGAATADLGTCPFGRVTSLSQQLPTSVSVPDEVISGTDTAIATADPSTVQCDLAADDPGKLTGNRPGQITFIAELDPSRDYVAEVGDSTVNNVDLTIDRESSYRGGQLYGYCGDDPDLLRYCGASWVSNKDRIAISVTMRGTVSSKTASDSLTAVLDRMVSSLADQG
ncbi:MAG: hypothetical protein JWN62_2016 [Acidimicrobiales bacterium]|nr:hypothetical protein [Acidimicrobiales bacterium]